MPGQELEEKACRANRLGQHRSPNPVPDNTSQQIKPCWPNHPEAQWELAWLYHLWTRAYIAEHPVPKDAADWHDRWASGVIRRLSPLMRRCETECRRHLDAESAGEIRQPTAP
jgi:hypothetical protein